MPAVSDEEVFVIRSAQGGDRAAWQRLFEWHFGGVYRYCLNLSAGEHSLAEDITQQAFVTAARRIEKFDFRGSTFRAWLIGIARRTYMKHRSREVRRKWYEVLFFQAGRAQGSPPEDVSHEVLAQLPLRYREVLEAKYFEGLTVSQIAQMRGETVKATESVLARAREMFASLYAKAARAAE
jgi:RNA polymerase sigma-70 factor, ECF subfamily